MDTPLFLSERIRVVSVMLMRDKNIKYEVTECARFCVSRYMLALLMERARNLTWWYVSPSLQEDEQFANHTHLRRTQPRPYGTAAFFFSATWCISFYPSTAAIFPTRLAQVNWWLLEVGELPHGSGPISRSYNEQ